MSALTLAKQGINKAACIHTLSTQWTLTQHEQDTLQVTRYYTRQWQGRYIHAQLHDGAIFVQADNLKYIISYHRCTASQVFKADQVRMSFRSSPVYGSYVLVYLTDHPPYSKGKEFDSNCEGK